LLRRIAYQLPQPINMKSTSTSIATLENPARLSRYQGPWNIEAASHLLRRTTYGARKDDIERALAAGMDATIDELLSTHPLPDEPINFDYDEDSIVAIGDSWINKTYAESDANNRVVGSRRRSLAAWTFDTLVNSGMNIREKMTLFWSNHFVTQASVLQDPNLIYFHNKLIKTHALGNFRTLAEEVTVSPSMLRYLNGNQNSAKAPNENYARELLELFTVGKGEQVGDGDYTTFTEEDVFAAAKVLTGWRDQGYFVRDGIPPSSTFIPGRHDRTTKQFSSRLGNATIENQGEQEYKTLIDIILRQDATATYLSRKIYRWFVYYDITEEIENGIIAEMATTLRETNYEIKPVLNKLLSSEHFYSICSVGPMIKNPIDFIINLFTQFEITSPTDRVEAYQFYDSIIRGLEALDMNYYEPPNVAGFKAYYQEPLFYRSWITATTLPLRQAYTTALATGYIRLRKTDQLLGIDILKYITKLESPDEADSLIKELATIHMPQPLSEAQIINLKEVLIPGLPDFEWTVEYNKYLSDPENEETRLSVEKKLRSFLIVFLNLAEYNLS